MRHGKKFNHLGKSPSHRKAMLSNMASSLIMEKRITTTVAKAKALRKYVEPLLTKSKTDDTHSRRVVFSYLQDKESVSELFSEVADRIASRPGGYTRILKTGNRLGDNADMCVIELVDYNEALLKEEKPKKAKTRRSRRGKGASTSSAQDTAGSQPDKSEETPVDEAVVEAEEVTELEEPAVEEGETADTNEPAEPAEDVTEIEDATESKDTESNDEEASSEAESNETKDVAEDKKDTTESSEDKKE